MQLSTELTLCACWTVWRWLPGRRGWRLQELFSTWLRVSSHHLKFCRWPTRTFPFSVLYLCGHILSLLRHVCRVQLWSWGAALDEIQHLSAAGRGDLLSSGGTSQHGDRVRSQLSIFLATQKTACITYTRFLLLRVSNLTLWAIFALVLKKPNIFSLPSSNSAACSSAVRKPAISLADSTDLRVLLNIMYLVVETIQQDDPADKPEWKIIRETFRAELGEYQQRSQRAYDDKLA